MDLTQFFTPTLLTVVVSAIVGLIVKAVRLQGKVDKLSEDAVERDKTIATQIGLLDAHRANADIHFNQRLATEVEHRQNDRMQRMEKDLHEIKTLVKEIAAK